MRIIQEASELAYQKPERRMTEQIEVLMQMQTKHWAK